MASYDAGKAEDCAWIREHVPIDATILDVGACDGKWKRLLPEYKNMDAVEIFAPNVYNNALDLLYRRVYTMDIADLNYPHYELVIFGDVIEHMTVEQARRVIEYAKDHSTDYIIGVPWEYKQGEIYGNKWERHIQDDLTPDIFARRYPGHAVLHELDFYCYYHRAT